eukprot:gb/GECH01008270.1/.p1 GENE.gb/GECH01008270.1/~~gb/GECH01008270.1/.p1  ORF type:complete len:233 (+),score=32.37 gb/GECH01008270.1/:1-699(+)
MFFFVLNLLILSIQAINFILRRKKNRNISSLNNNDDEQEEEIQTFLINSNISSVDAESNHNNDLEWEKFEFTMTLVQFICILVITLLPQFLISSLASDHPGENLSTLWIYCSLIPLIGSFLIFLGEVLVRCVWRSNDRQFSYHYYHHHCHHYHQHSDGNHPSFLPFFTRRQYLFVLSVSMFVPLKMSVFDNVPLLLWMVAPHMICILPHQIAVMLHLLHLGKLGRMSSKHSK